MSDPKKLHVPLLYPKRLMHRPRASSKWTKHQIILISEQTDLNQIKLLLVIPLTLYRNKGTCSPIRFSVTSGFSFHSVII